MRASYYHIIMISLIAATQAGCGTLHNLDAPPVSEPGTAVPIGGGQGICVPFGGVGRSALLGIFGTPAGASAVADGGLILVCGDAQKGLATMGNGLWFTGVGLVALADTPLSLAGDIVTWPVAYARQQQQPWATWWGSKNNAWWFQAPFATRPTDEPEPRLDDNGKQPRGTGVGKGENGSGVEIR